MFAGADLHSLVDFAVIIFTVLQAINSAFQASENNKIKMEIMTLKLWIIQNFHPKNDADFAEVKKG